MLSGESCIREVVAYLIDNHNFSGVPATTFVEVVHNSLKYVPFSGLEVNSDTYFEIMSSLIKPTNIESEDKKTMTNTPESLASTANAESLKANSNLISQSNTDTVTSRIAHEKDIGMKFGSL